MDNKTETYPLTEDEKKAIKNWVFKRRNKSVAWNKELACYSDWPPPEGGKDNDEAKKTGNYPIRVFKGKAHLYLGSFPLLTSIEYVGQTYEDVRFNYMYSGIEKLYPNFRPKADAVVNYAKAVLNKLKNLKTYK